MNDITLRSAIESDLPILLSFEQGIVEAERPYDKTLGEDINYYDIGEMINDKSVEVIVAEIEGVVIASAYAAIRKAQPYLDHQWYAYLGFMYVTPECRGRGINKLIIDRLIKWSKSRNVTELRLDVYEENDAAIRAYEKVGFKKQMVNMRIRV